MHHVGLGFGSCLALWLSLSCRWVLADVTRFPFSLRSFDKRGTCLSVEAEIQHIIARLISRTGVLRPEKRVTPHSIFDSCRPIAAILGHHGASGPVWCVPLPLGSCRACSCGLEYMDVWTLLSARGWRSPPRLSAGSAGLCLPRQSTSWLPASSVTEGNDKHITS